jgi:hypothetical protein
MSRKYNFATSGDVALYALLTATAARGSNFAWALLAIALMAELVINVREVRESRRR